MDTIALFTQKSMRAERLLGPLRCVLDGGCIGDVYGEREGLDAKALDLGASLVETDRLAREQRNGVAAAPTRPRHSPADARRGARDDNDAHAAQSSSVALWADWRKSANAATVSVPAAIRVALGVMTRPAVMSEATQKPVQTGQRSN